MHKDTETILDEAKRIVYGERGENYGHPFEDFSRTAKIWSAVLDIEVTPEQVALCMVGLKISREVNRPKRDNVVDGAGYFENLDMVKRERSRREHPSYKEPKLLNIGESIVSRGATGISSEDVKVHFDWEMPRCACERH